MDCKAPRVWQMLEKRYTNVLNSSVVLDKLSANKILFHLKFLSFLYTVGCSYKTAKSLRSKMALHCIKNHESIYHKSERTRMTLLWTRSKRKICLPWENSLMIMWNVSLMTSGLLASLCHKLDTLESYCA